MGRLPKLAAFLDIHTDGQMVVRPLAYTSTPAPNGAAILQWADTMSRAMTAAHGVNHHIERAGETDPTGGLAQDYATIEFSVVGLTMELRHGTSLQGFGDRASNIAPTCDEALAGFLSVAVPLAEATPPPTPLADAGTPMPTAGAGGRLHGCRRARAAGRGRDDAVGWDRRSRATHGRNRAAQARPRFRCPAPPAHPRPRWPAPSPPPRSAAPRRNSHPSPPFPARRLTPTVAAASTRPAPTEARRTPRSRCSRSLASLPACAPRGAGAIESSIRARALRPYRSLLAT